ncbi:MAG: DUF349 domain-containing protein [Bacteroidales bacterium]|jgi:hypothetical protein|nr:DUF349 domain-containing protein [Bacteroidales bacterium]
MEPKDLKNASELEYVKNSEFENSEKNFVSSEEQQTGEKPLAEETVKTINGLDDTIVSENLDKELVSEQIQEHHLHIADNQNKIEKTEIIVSEDKIEVETEAFDIESTGNETPKLEEEIIVVTEKEISETKNRKKDYLTYSQEELVDAIRKIIENTDETDIKEEVDTIRSVFYKNHKNKIEEQKKKFLEEGKNIEEFVAAFDPYEQDMKELLKRYHNMRIDFNKKLEIEKEENLKLKYQIIEEIKALINKEESINKTFHEFRELQRRWREIGLVPQTGMKNLWDTYNFHVENFYNYININKELRDLDLKKNLETKIELCKRTEELLLHPNVVNAFNVLQKFHEEWREIGPVPVEHKDSIWERFKAATLKINKKYHEYFENRKDEQKSNLEAKIALCEKVEEILASEISTHKEWDEKSKQLVELQKMWRTIGFVMRKDNNKVYERFHNACDKFFDAKREYYSKNKDLKQNNLQLKMDLCVEAETLKDSTDWRKTTQDFIALQKKWKEAGPVPRKYSDNLWKRFCTACDYFFEKKSNHFSSIDLEHDENRRLKKELIAEVENFKPSENVEENVKTIKLFQKRWIEIGHVPVGMKDEIQNTFKEAINKLYDTLNIDEGKRNMIKFKSKITSLSETTRGHDKMRLERDKYVGKLRQLQNDLALFDNNIGFFAKSKNAESLIEEVKQKIEDTKQNIELLKQKIKAIDSMNSDE